MSDVRVRFAPSPTGFLHVGGLRTALFNYLFAARTGGKLILRIEDTDQTRRVEGAVENLWKSLAWAGLRFDESPETGGEFGPYIQSERLELYAKYTHQLIEQGDAYYCFCSEERLKRAREKQHADGQDTRYDGRCGNLSKEEVDRRLRENQPHVVRMRVDRERENYLVRDLVRGDIVFNPDQIDDQILMKSDGFPTYHLANVVDDHLMKISHVIRGEEWLPSTPKHILLYQFFGWTPPAFAHLPLLLNQDRSKLSKRQGDVATEEYKRKGILPECLINFVALLGWHAGEDKELFSMEELIESFSLDRIQKAGAVFDMDKLKWMNQQYIKQLSDDSLMERLQPFLPDFAKNESEERLRKILSVIRDYLTLLSDVESQLDLFFNENPKLSDPTLIERVKEDSFQTVYSSFLRQVEEQETLTAENFGQIMKRVQKETGVKGKNLWIPIRIAITLLEQGPDLTAVVDIFGKDKCLKMVRQLLLK